MHIHCFQHVPFETPAYISSYFSRRGYTLEGVPLHAGVKIPPADKISCAIILGGPMGVSQTDRYPFLAEEVARIQEMVHLQRPVLGICLGAQLIAAALGARVYTHLHREIGWFEVKLTPQGRRHPLFEGVPPLFQAFHWHGDTFDVPHGANWCARSEATASQAFVVGSVVGLQFHLEITPQSIENLLKNCAHELQPGPFVQEADFIRSQAAKIGPDNTIFERIWENFEKTFSF